MFKISFVQLLEPTTMVFMTVEITVPGKTISRHMRRVIMKTYSPIRILILNYSGIKNSMSVG